MPVIAASLEDVQQIADAKAGVPCRDPWAPVYSESFSVALPEDAWKDREVRRQPRNERDS